MGNKDSHDVDIELEGKNVLNIHVDAPIISYL
jgi:hypothetical protein